MCNWKACFGYAGLLGLIGLVGCATVDPAMVRERAAGKSVMIVVGVPDEVVVQWIGTTVFNNEYGKERFEGVAVKAIIGTTSADLLKQANRYSAVEVMNAPGHDREALLKEVTSSTELSLVFSPCGFQDLAFGSNQSFHGVGVMQRSLFGLPPKTATYAALCADLVDGRTRERIASVGDVSFQRFETASVDSGPTIKREARSSIEDSLTYNVHALIFRLIDRLGLN